MTIKKKITIRCTIFLCGLLQNSYAQINTQVPVSYHSNQDQISATGINITGSSNTRIHLIQLANKYLWIILVVVLLFVTIRAGAKIMSGNNENSGKTLTNALIAILIAIFSYTIIKLLVNLF